MARDGVGEARRLARREFMAGWRLDLGRLSAQLGVNRATLYRWVGSRDELLVDVLWSLADEVLTEVRQRTPGEGAHRVVAVVTGFLDDVITADGMRRFLAQEGELALRLLTRADKGFQPRLVAAMRELLVEERLDALPVDVDELAFVLVRLIESYTYLDLLTGQPADARRAEPVLRLLLR